MKISRDRNGHLKRKWPICRVVSKHDVYWRQILRMFVSHLTEFELIFSVCKFMTDFIFFFSNSGTEANMSLSDSKVEN